MKTLKSKTVRAVGWALGSKFASQILSLTFGIVLARLLLPDDFGLVAMVAVFTGLSQLLADVGLGSALIQKKDLRDEHFSSVFWINIILGFSLAAAFYYFAPFLGSFFEREEVVEISQALSLIFVIGAIELVPRTRLVKKLLFKYVSISNIFAMVVSGGVAIYLAVNDFGYWSLVIQQLLHRLLSTLFIFLVGGWFPRFNICFTALNEIFGFSINVFITQLVQYGGKNVDKLLVGKMLGGEMLGVYSKAQSMMLFPLQNISHVIGQVMFSSLSIIQSDKERVRGVYLRATSAISLVTFPMMAGMLVLSESFVLGVLGEHWRQMIPVLQVLSLAGFATSISTVTGSLYKSQGAVKLQLKVTLLIQTIKLIGVIIGLKWGVVGVATGYAVASLISSQITLAIGGGLVYLKLLPLLSQLMPTFITAISMAMAVHAIRIFSSLESELNLFFIQTLSGVAIYIAILILFRVRALSDVFTVLTTEFRGKIKGA